MPDNGNDYLTADGRRMAAGGEAVVVLMD